MQHNNNNSLTYDGHSLELLKLNLVVRNILVNSELYSRRYTHDRPPKTSILLLTREQLASKREVYMPIFFIAKHSYVRNSVIRALNAVFSTDVPRQFEFQ